MANFYGKKISIPLSAYHNTGEWAGSVMAKLSEKNDNIWIEEIKPPLKSLFGWRVTDVRLSSEDGVMSYFRAYGEQGDHLSDAAFGVTWANCPHRIEFPDSNYYVPVNGFATVNEGGYFVKVLDWEYPSERLAFGLVKQDQHQGLIVTFRLFQVGPGYPNDKVF